MQATSENVSIEGTWKLEVKGPTGPISTVLVIEDVNGALGGTQTGQGSSSAITDLKVDGSQISWVNHITKPMKIKVTFTGELRGNTISGKCKAGFMPGASFSGIKA